jgi:hypothetical protein
MKTIEITVSPQGETSIQTKGFEGSDCREATKTLEAALGRSVQETLTSEFYSHQSHTQEQTHQI